MSHPQEHHGSAEGKLEAEHRHTDSMNAPQKVETSRHLDPTRRHLDPYTGDRSATGGTPPEPVPWISSPGSTSPQLNVSARFTPLAPPETITEVSSSSYSVPPPLLSAAPHAESAPSSPSGGQHTPCCGGRPTRRSSLSSSSSSSLHNSSVPGTGVRGGRRGEVGHHTGMRLQSSAEFSQPALVAEDTLYHISSMSSFTPPVRQGGPRLTDGTTSMAWSPEEEEALPDVTGVSRVSSSAGDVTLPLPQRSSGSVNVEGGASERLSSRPHPKVRFQSSGTTSDNAESIIDEAGSSETTPSPPLLAAGIKHQKRNDTSHLSLNATSEPNWRSSNGSGSDEPPRGAETPTSADAVPSKDPLPPRGLQQMHPHTKQYSEEHFTRCFGATASELGSWKGGGPQSALSSPVGRPPRSPHIPLRFPKVVNPSPDDGLSSPVFPRFSTPLSRDPTQSIDSVSIHRANSSHVFAKASYARNLPSHLLPLAKEIHKLDHYDLSHIAYVTERLADKEVYSLLPYSGANWFLPEIRPADVGKGEKRWEVSYEWSDGLVVAVAGQRLSIRVLNLLIRLALLVLLWLLLWEILPHTWTEPGGVVFDSVVLVLLSAVIGGFFCRLLHIPPVVGVLWVAICWHNIPSVNYLTKGVNNAVLDVASKAGLTVILAKAGYSISPRDIKPHWKQTLLLALVPFGVEGIVGGLLANVMMPYHHNYNWAFLQGMLCAVGSPAVIIPAAYFLAKMGYVEQKVQGVGPLSLMVSAIPIEIVLGVWSVNFIISFIFRHFPVVILLVLAPVQLVGGGGGGIAVGFGFHYAVELLKREARRLPNGRYRPLHFRGTMNMAFVLFITTCLVIVIGSYKLKLAGGGCVMCVTFSATVSNVWTRKKSRILRVPPSQLRTFSRPAVAGSADTDAAGAPHRSGDHSAQRVAGLPPQGGSSSRIFLHDSGTSLIQQESPTEIVSGDSGVRLPSPGEQPPLPSAPPTTPNDSETEVELLEVEVTEDYKEQKLYLGSWVSELWDELMMPVLFASMGCRINLTEVFQGSFIGKAFALLLIGTVLRFLCIIAIQCRSPLSWRHRLVVGIGYLGKASAQASMGPLVATLMIEEGIPLWGSGGPNEDPEKLALYTKYAAEIKSISAFYVIVLAVVASVGTVTVGHRLLMYRPEVIETPEPVDSGAGVQRNEELPLDVSRSNSEEAVVPKKKRVIRSQQGSMAEREEPSPMNPNLTSAALRSHQQTKERHSSLFLSTASDHHFSAGGGGGRAFLPSFSPLSSPTAERGGSGMKCRFPPAGDTSASVGTPVSLGTTALLKSLSHHRDEELPSRPFGASSALSPQSTTKEEEKFSGEEQRRKRT